MGDATRELGREERQEFLLLRASGRTCAIAIRDVVETMRPLPVAPLAGVPAFVRGAAIIRGTPVPVLDLGMMLGGAADQAATRFVTVRAGARSVALAVQAVPGMRALESAALGVLPPLLQGVRAEMVASIGSLDRELMVVLAAGKLLSEADWADIARGEGT